MKTISMIFQLVLACKLLLTVTKQEVYSYLGSQYMSTLRFFPASVFSIACHLYVKCNELITGRNLPVGFLSLHHHVEARKINRKPFDAGVYSFNRISSTTITFVIKSPQRKLRLW